MAINRIKKSLATRIASCKSKTIPSRLLQWAQKHVEALAGTTSTTTDGSSPQCDNDDSPPAPRDSSVSSVPFLELTLDDTKLSARSCLKKERRGSDGSAAPPTTTTTTKHVGFVCNDRLLKCMVTGAHLDARARTPEMTEEFRQRAVDRHEQRRINRLARRLAREAAGISSDEASSSSSSSDDEQPQCDDSSSSSDESDEQLYDPGNVADMALRENHVFAKRARVALTVETIAGGGMDFALYVVRDEDLLRALERTMEKYAHLAKIASYRGAERRYAYCGVGSITELPIRFYDDYGTAMSGSRTLRPVSPNNKKKRTPTVGAAAVTAPEMEGSLAAEHNQQEAVATLVAISEADEEPSSKVDTKTDSTALNTVAVTEAITDCITAADTEANIDV